MTVLSRLRALIHSDERGSAMTEFVFFLPIWITVFIGIFALGRMGIETTKMRLQTQQSIWDTVIPITSGSAFSMNGSPILAGGEAALNMGELAADSDNPQQLADGVETVIQGALTVGGTFGESYARVIPYNLAGAVLPGDFAQVADLTALPQDTILNKRKFPISTMYDGVAQTSNSGIGSIIASVAAASGFIPSIAAGIRWGTVFGEIDDRVIPLAGGRSTKASIHYDILVAPAPQQSALLTFTTAWLMAETPGAISSKCSGSCKFDGTGSGYWGLFFFGPKNFSGAQSSSSSHDTSGAGDPASQTEEAKEDSQEEVAERCKNYESLPKCQECSAFGKDATKCPMSSKYEPPED